MADQGLPTFDLVVATVGRTTELERLLDSLAAQTHQGFRVLLIDQNDEGYLDGVLASRRDFEVTRLRSRSGLSRARNAALARIEADLVGFPDDDALLPPDLLERAATRFAADPELDGIAGRVADATGRSAANASREAGVVTLETVWYRTISAGLFLRAALVARVGSFDESMGVGSGSLWSSGEEIDYVARAVKEGARIEYEPDFVVVHRLVSCDELLALGRRDGASVGYVLGKNDYPLGQVARMLARPLGGAARSLVRRDLATARFHADTLRGRLTGLRAGRRMTANVAADRHREGPFQP